MKVLCFFLDYILIRIYIHLFLKQTFLFWEFHTMHPNSAHFTVPRYSPLITVALPKKENKTKQASNQNQEQKQNQKQNKAKTTKTP